MIRYNDNKYKADKDSSEAVTDDKNHALESLETEMKTMSDSCWRWLDPNDTQYVSMMHRGRKPSPDDLFDLAKR